MAVGAGSASHMRWDASDAALIGASSATVCTSLFVVTRTPTEPEMQTVVTVSVDGAEIKKERSHILHINIIQYIIIAIGQMLAATVVIGRMLAATVVAIGRML